MKVINSYSDVEKRSKYIGDKTIYYKKILVEKKEIYPKVKYIMENIKDGVEFKSLSVEDTGFSIFVKVDNPLDFTNLIFRYLEGNVVSEIIIESASLDISDGRFSVYMRGIFKWFVL